MKIMSDDKNTETQVDETVETVEPTLHDRLVEVEAFIAKAAPILEQLAAAGLKIEEATNGEHSLLTIIGAVARQLTGIHIL